ncbi:hypothetical protein [Brevibacillus borstelensis]|uniref:hypothetical protein n=1 Tax=Brevibacillus borstelensis TaxID=45462 RepID=UPI0030C15FC4
MSPDDVELLEYLLLFYELSGQYICGEEAVEIAEKILKHDAANGAALDIVRRNRNG